MEQNNKVHKVNKKSRGKSKKSKKWGSEWIRGQEGAPGPHGAGSSRKRPLKRWQ